MLVKEHMYNYDEGIKPNHPLNIPFGRKPECPEKAQHCGAQQVVITFTTFFKTVYSNLDEVECFG